MFGFRVTAVVLAFFSATLPAIALDKDLLESAVVQQDTYIIGPGDVLDLKLFDASDLSGTLAVLNDSTVSLPLVGSVRLNGLTSSKPLIVLSN